MEYKVKVTEVAIEHDGPIDMETTFLRVLDEGTGSYIELSQADQTIRLDPEELKLMFLASNKLLNGGYT